VDDLRFGLRPVDEVTGERPGAPSAVIAGLDTPVERGAVSGQAADQLGGAVDLGIILIGSRKGGVGVDLQPVLGGTARPGSPCEGDRCAGYGSGIGR